MVVLIEKTMESYVGHRDEIHFDYMLEETTHGRAVGIVLMWVTSMVIVTYLRQSEQELHAMIQVNPNHKSWLFSIIYAGTKFDRCRLLWDSLENLSHTYNAHWFVAGDFNDIFKSRRKLWR